MDRVPLFTDLDRQVFVVLTLMIVAIRSAYVWKLRHRKAAALGPDPRDKRLLVIVFVTVVLIPFTYVLTPCLRFADYARPEWLAWPGAVIMLVGIVVFYRSHADLGRNWSGWLETCQDHRLVTSGSYRIVRHPQYAAVLVCGIGQSLLLDNWLAGPSNIVAATALLVLRAPREEKVLLKVFGDEYRAYCEETPRLLVRVATLIAKDRVNVC